MGIRVAVAGASGYAGGELLRLIAGHPELDLVAATAHSQAGAAGRRRAPAARRASTWCSARPTRPTLADADLVFLALPHGESAAARRRSCRPASRSSTSAPTTG